MNPNRPFSTRLGMSTPDSRNMDTMARMAKGLRSRMRVAQDLDDMRDYVEHVATNLERMAEDYYTTMQAMVAARTALIAVQEITIGVVGQNITPEPEGN